MLDNQPNLEAWLNGGEVQRFHQWPMLSRQQTVGEHTFNMLLISTHLYFPSSEGQEDYLAEMLALQQAILFHDVAEGRRGTSDISAWAKRRWPDLKPILRRAEGGIATDLGFRGWVTPYSDRNTRRLKTCDRLELMWTVLSQRMLGNRTLFDAAWPVIMEMMSEMTCDMETREMKLYMDWRERARKYR